MTQGDLWHRMHVQPRRAAASLTGREVRTRPGVYAWYREGEPVYSGRAIGADGLHGRIWKNHLKTGDNLSRSSFRRNVCERDTTEGKIGFHGGKVRWIGRECAASMT